MKDKIAVIHQPDFMPYLGFFDRLLKADIYVILDNVQYVRGTSRAWTSRDKIKTQTGERWITVGTQKAPMGTPINQIILKEDNNWRKEHLNLFKENYRKAPYYNEIIPHLIELYNFSAKRMMDFNVKSIEMLMKLFDIQIETVIASSLNPKGKNNSLVIDILEKISCRKYLSGVGARDYYVPELYEEAGIEVLWQEFEHPVYQQQFEGFIPYLSSIDLLFNCGIEESRKIIRGE